GGGHARVPPGLGDDGGVVVDLVLLGGDQENVHVPLPPAGSLQDLIGEIDVLHVERDVLLRLPGDDLGQLLLGRRRDGDFLDDDAVPGEGYRHVTALGLAGGDAALHGVDDRAG